MSTSASNQSLNPFASPAVAEAISVPASSPKKNGRLTEKTLAAISRCCCVADCSFLLTVICFQMSYCPWYNVSYMFQQHVLIAYTVFSFLLWFAVVAIAFRTLVAGDIFMAFFLLPIPGLGALVFLAIRLGLAEKMVQNGFRPRLFGFARDSEQRRAMEADPEYRPNVKFELDGSKRKKVFSLCDITFILGTICVVVPIAMPILLH